MGEVDYQLALLLQHQFEQELSRNQQPQNSDFQLAIELQKQFENPQPTIKNSDLQLAKELQDQFRREQEIERPSNNLIYDTKTVHNSSKSLTDPSWEVIDPTPDVHVLFMAFDQRFFWNSLQSVCVSWSKRMTTCAGICSYQGRGGMCHITLSEPLLKLRPRKDLVETLLHEMIHAYLFLTNNNRDRDGHGPEFHKHMYRINKEAGTNITVYHSFHDEVRLYQQHWWRCDGPCQQWKPYFGMVRRATNRAPGPNDRWWGQHSRSCGGTFLKVKEPEKIMKVKTTTKTKKVTSPPKSAGDIREFFPTVSKNNSFSNVQPSTKVNTAPTQISAVLITRKDKTPDATNPNDTSKQPKERPKSTSSITKPRKKLNNIILISKKTPNPPRNDAKESKSAVPVLKESGNTSTSSIKSPKDSEEYSVVRNHWLNKFDNTNKKIGQKRPISSASKDEPNNKFLKRTSSVTSTESSNTECPVCGIKISLNSLNQHLDVCLTSSSNNTRVKTCFICDMKLTENEYDAHFSKCCGGSFRNDDVFEESQNNVVGDDTSEVTSVVDLTADDDEETRVCQICEKAISINIYHQHTADCLVKMCDEINEKYKNDNKTNCLACGHEILKAELNNHLEECMNMTFVFDTSRVPIEEAAELVKSGRFGDSNAYYDDSETAETSSNYDMEYNCPICTSLIPESKMNEHVNVCLNGYTSSNERNMFLDSFNYENFD